MVSMRRLVSERLSWPPWLWLSPQVERLMLARDLLLEQRPSLRAAGEVDPIYEDTLQRRLTDQDLAPRAPLHEALQMLSECSRWSSDWRMLPQAHVRPPCIRARLVPQPN